MIDICPLGPWDSVHSRVVVPGKRYNFWAYIATHRCDAALVAYFLTDSGEYCGDGLHTTGWMAGGPGGRSLAQFEQFSLFATAPANAASVLFAVRKGNTYAGAVPDDSFMFIGPSLFAEVATLQSQPSMYSAGSPLGRLSTVDQITPGNVATYIANAAVGTLNLAGNAVTIPLVATGTHAASVVFTVTPQMVDSGGGMWFAMTGTAVLGNGVADDTTGRTIQMLVNTTVVSQEIPLRYTTGTLISAQYLGVGTYTFTIRQLAATGDVRTGITVLGAKR